MPCGKIVAPADPLFHSHISIDLRTASQIRTRDLSIGYYSAVRYHPRMTVLITTLHDPASNNGV